MQDGGFRFCGLNHQASDSKTSWHQAGLRQIRERKRGHSLMVKFQPSKLAMRVRSPLPALPFSAGYSHFDAKLIALRARL
jgi:hypothetical protein